MILCESTEAGRAMEPVICRDAPGVERDAIHDRIASVALKLYAPYVVAGESTAR